MLPVGTKLKLIWFFDRTVSVCAELHVVCPSGVSPRHTWKYLFSNTLGGGKVCSSRHPCSYQNLLLCWNAPVLGKDSLGCRDWKAKLPRPWALWMVWDDGALAPRVIPMEVVSARAERQLCSLLQ